MSAGAPADARARAVTTFLAEIGLERLASELLGTLGVDSLDDLQFVTKSMLEDIGVRPVQCAKLLYAISERLLMCPQAPESSAPTAHSLTQTATGARGSSAADSDSATEEALEL